MPTGRVKRYSSKCDYFFIRHEGKDLYCHRSDTVPVNALFRKGEKLRFDIAADGTGLRAVNVQKI